MNRFYLLVSILFVTGKGTLSAQLPEHLNSREGITLEIKRVEDEILKRRAIATFLEDEGDRWYFVRLIWWSDSIMAWKLADKEYERIKLLKEEATILKRLLASYPSSQSMSVKTPSP